MPGVKGIIMNTSNHLQLKTGKLSAGAFAALLLLTTGAPLVATEIQTLQNTESSQSGSSGGSTQSSAGSHRSGGDSGRSRGDGGGSRGGGSRDGGSRDGGSRGDGGSREGRGGDRGDRGGRNQADRDGNRDGRGDRDHRYGRGDRDRDPRHGHPRYPRYPYRYGGYYGWGGYGGWGVWGGWPWWYPGYGHGPTVIIEADPYGYSGGRDSGALDLDLTPEKAQIFVDGNFVGQADDYDGFPTFLWLPSGTYDVAFFHEGYQTIVRQYTVRPGVIIDVEDRMFPGQAVPPQELMTPKSTERRDARIERNERQEAEVERREQAAAERGEAAVPSNVGRLYLSLWPPDAAIYLDGNFLGTAEEVGQLSAGLVVEPGDHELEVVRPGYGTSRRTITVPAGERIEVKFDLDKN